jgi:hypothetical protein
MKQYFFDLATPKGCFYDYQGKAFVEMGEAQQVAELIAADLASTNAFDWMGTAIKIRDVFGKTLFSVSVPDGHLNAA